MTRTASFFLGTALATAILAGPAHAAPAISAPAGTDAPPAAASSGASAAVYGMPHVEALLTDALSRHITVGRLKVELDSRAVELRAPQGSASPTVENLYYSPVQGRFAAEIVVAGADARPVARVPVSGRAFGMVQVPVLSRRIAPGDLIGSGDVDWQEVRADQTGSDIAATDAQLIGQTPRRGVPVNQPVRLRDLQSPRLIDKGALVTITLSTPTITLSAQGKALQEGGKGDVIRVVNTQSNRIVEATVAGPNLVAVAKPGVAAY